MPQKYRNPNQFNLDDDDPWSPANFGLTPHKNQNQFGMSAEDDPWSPQNMGLQPLSTPNLRPPAESMYEPQSDYFNPRPQQPPDDGFGWDDVTQFAKDAFTVPNAVRFGGSAVGDYGAAATLPWAIGAIPATFGTSLLVPAALKFGGGYLGETGGRALEGKPFESGINTVEGAMNFLPGLGKLPGAGAGARELLGYGGKQVVSGIGQGLLGTAPRKYAAEGTLTDPSKWTVPTGYEFGTQAASGGAFQGLTSLGLGAGHIAYKNSLADLQARAGQPRSKYMGKLTVDPPTNADPLRGIGEPNMPPGMLGLPSGPPPSPDVLPVTPDFMPTGATELPDVVTLRSPDVTTLNMYLQNGYVRVPGLRSPEGYAQLVRGDVAAMYTNAGQTEAPPQSPPVQSPIEQMQPPPVQQPQEPDFGPDLDLYGTNNQMQGIPDLDLNQPSGDIGNLRLQGTLGQNIDPSTLPPALPEGIDPPTQGEMGQVELPPVDTPIQQPPDQLAQVPDNDPYNDPVSMGGMDPANPPTMLHTAIAAIENTRSIEELDDLHNYWTRVAMARPDFADRAYRLQDIITERSRNLSPAPVPATSPAPIQGRSADNPIDIITGREELANATTPDEVNQIHDYWDLVYDAAERNNNTDIMVRASRMMDEANRRYRELEAPAMNQPTASDQNIPQRPDRYNEPIYSLVDADELHVVQAIDNMGDLERLERLQQIEADTVLQNQAQNGVDEPPSQRIQRLVLEDETRRRRLELTNAHPDLLAVYDIHSATGITDAIGGRLRQIVDAQNSGNNFLLNHAREVAQELRDRQDRMVNPMTMEFHGAPESRLASAAIEPTINMASQQIPFTDAENAIINTLNMSTSQMVDTIEDVRTFDLPSLQLLHDDWHYALTQARDHHDTLSADEATRMLDLIRSRIQTRTDPSAATATPSQTATDIILARPEVNQRMRDTLNNMDLEEGGIFNNVTRILDASDRPTLQNLRSDWGTVWTEANNAGDMAGMNEADDMLAIIGNRIANIDRPGSAVTSTTSQSTPRAYGPPVHRPSTPAYTPTIRRGPAFELGPQPRNTSQQYDMTQEQYDRIANSPSVRAHLNAYTGGEMRRLTTQEMRDITARNRNNDWSGFGTGIARQAGDGPPGLSVEIAQEPSWSRRPPIVGLPGMTDQHPPGKYNIVWRNAQGQPVVNAIMEIYADGSRMVNNLGGYVSTEVFDPATNTMKEVANPDFTPAFNAVGRRMVELDTAVTHGGISHHTGNLLVGILQRARIAGAPERQRVNRPPRPGSRRDLAIQAGLPDPALALRERSSGPDRSGEGGFASLDVMVAMYEAIQRGLKAAPNLFKDKRNTFPDLVKSLEIMTGKSQWFLSKVAKETQDAYNRSKSERGAINIPGKPPTQGPSRQPLMQKMGIGQGTQPTDEYSFIREALAVPTNLTTSMDASAPGRQGLPNILTKEFWVAAKNMFGGISPAGFKQIDDALKQTPLHKQETDPRTGKLLPSFGMQIGSKLFRPASEAGPHAEATASRWLETGGLFGPEKIFGVNNPLRSTWKHTAGIGIRASNRMYITFLNHLNTNRTQKLLDLARDMSIEGITTGRMPKPGIMGGMQIGGKRLGFTQAVSPLQAMDRNPYHNLVLARDIAELVNVTTGHATARGALETAVKKIGPVLFSPGLLNSRIRMLNPFTYIKADPFVRKQYLKAALSTAAAWWMVVELAKMAGGDDVEVSTDTNSADYGKPRIGDTRLDPGGGFQQFLVLYSRLLSAGATSSKNQRFHPFGKGYQAETALTTTQRFLANKLNPAAKFAYDLWDSSEYKPLHLKDRTMQAFAPLIGQDLYEIYNEDPDLLPILGPLAAVGMGTQIYGKGESVGKFIDPKNDIIVQGDIRPWKWGGKPPVRRRRRF